MRKFNKVILVLVVGLLLAALGACGKEDLSEINNEIYDDAISALSDDELFALIDINATYNVLLVTSQYYDDGNANQASIWCDVYYAVDGKGQKIGQVQSMGTAYPIAYDKNGIYAASGNEIECYQIDEENGVLKLAEHTYERLDNNGNSTYIMEKNYKESEISEKEFYGAFEKYGDATVVNFTYGAWGTSR